MNEEKKTTYKGLTPARKKANDKYLKESVDEIKIRVPKGRKAEIKDHADKAGESMNAYIINAIDKRIEEDNK